MVTRKKPAAPETVTEDVTVSGLVAVTVKGPVHVTHDGRLYKTGETVAVPDEVAAQLLRLGVVTKAKGR